MITNAKDIQIKINEVLNIQTMLINSRKESVVLARQLFVALLKELNLPVAFAARLVKRTSWSFVRTDPFDTRFNYKYTEEINTIKKWFIEEVADAGQVLLNIPSFTNAFKRNLSENRIVESVDFHFNKRIFNMPCYQHIVQHSISDAYIIGNYFTRLNIISSIEPNKRPQIASKKLYQLSHIIIPELLQSIYTDTNTVFN